MKEDAGGAAHIEQPAWPTCRAMHDCTAPIATVAPVEPPPPARLVGDRLLKRDVAFWVILVDRGDGRARVLIDVTTRLACEMPKALIARVHQISAFDQQPPIGTAAH